MTTLRKARLAELMPGDNPQERPRTSLDVPFNPTSLRVQIANKTAGGQQAGAQARQRPGTGEMQVAFDLIFDVTDQGGDVLQHTRMVERFVRPQGTAPGQEAPPRVRFEWGSFRVDGTMDSANIDLDLFDADGMPLRAKVSVTIKGQDPRWVYQSPPALPSTERGAGGAGGVNLPAGMKPGEPGTQGAPGLLDQVVQALPGEGLAQLASRVGLAPAAWRAMAAGLSNPLQLALGQEVGVPAGLSLGSASGRQAQGQDPARATACLPLVSAGSLNGGLAVGGGHSGAGTPAAATRSQGGEALRQGQAVTARGGLGASIQQVKGEAHQQQAQRSQQSFGRAVRVEADTHDRPWGAGVPLRPRIGSGVVASEPDAQRLALRQPVPSTTQGSRASSAAQAPRARTAASLSTTPVSRGCGCRGRRGRR